MTLSNVTIHGRDASEIQRALARATRSADKDFEGEGGTSRHWMQDHFLPALDTQGLAIIDVEAFEDFLRDRITCDVSDRSWLYFQQAENPVEAGIILLSSFQAAMAALDKTTHPELEPFVLFERKLQRFIAVLKHHGVDEATIDDVACTAPEAMSHRVASLCVQYYNSDGARALHAVLLNEWSSVVWFKKSK